MTTKTKLPTVKAFRHLTVDKEPKTICLMSDNSQKWADGHLNPPFVVTEYTGKDGKDYINIWSVAS